MPIKELEIYFVLYSHIHNKNDRNTFRKISDSFIRILQWPYRTIISNEDLKGYKLEHLICHEHANKEKQGKVYSYLPRKKLQQ